MKIAIVSLVGQVGSLTGDYLQAVKTASALKKAGHDAIHWFVDNNGLVFDEKMNSAGHWNQIFRAYDVIHTIPPIASSTIAGFSSIHVKMVTSSIFWRSFRYTWVVACNTGFSFGILRDFICDFLAFVGIKTWWRYSRYDLILPNSYDELQKVERYCYVKRGVFLRTIPNAIDEIPEWVDSLKRPDFLPIDDYIVCPAFFAPRKNQKLLVKAFQGTGYKIIFMGGGDSTVCRSIATDNMFFWGHVPHGSERFYQTLKFARVACLPSNCETPGIALLEAAALGVRPVISFEGGTAQYYGWDAEYFDPVSLQSLKTAVERAWERGRLNNDRMYFYKSLTWDCAAAQTLDAYAAVCG